MNALTNAETVGTSTEPRTTRSGLADATWPAIGVKSVTSAGNTLLTTDLTPAGSKMCWATGSCGWVNGSLTVTYAAVFGRSEAGRVATQWAKLTSELTTGIWTEKTLCRPVPNTAGPAPAPSTNA